MADHTPTLDSLLGNFDPSQIEITYYDWPERWELSLFDIGVRIELAGVIFQGRGIDSVEFVAIEKACSEALERCLVSKLRIPLSLSTAVHTSEDAARSVAYCEAFERDSFLVPFLLKQNPKKLEVSEFQHLLPSRFVLSGVEFEMLELPVLDSDLFSFCLVTKGMKAKSPFGVIVGLGCSTVRFSAIRKSVNECLARLASVIFIRDKEVTYIEVNENATNEVHFKRALTLEYSPDFFFPRGSTSVPASLMKKKSLELQNLKKFEDCFEIQERILPGNYFSGIYFASYQNSFLQPLFRGDTRSEFLNFERLNLKKEELCLIENQMHPLG